jgi:hypothetical protein
MYSSDITIEAAALVALESLIRTVYPNTETAPAGLAQDIIKQCLEILQEPEKSQGVASTKALAALIRGSRKYGLYYNIRSLNFHSFRRFLCLIPSPTSTIPPIQLSKSSFTSITHLVLHIVVIGGLSIGLCHT